MNPFFWYQSIGMIVSFFYIAYTAARFLKKESRFSLFKFCATLVIWGTVFLFSVFPPLPSILVKKLGLGDNLAILIFIAFIIVFAFIFKLLSIIEKLEKNITEIVRQDALKKIKK